MFLTDFADGAVTVPLAAAALAALLLAGERRAAAAWFAVVGATFATILALKLVFGFTCAPGLASPSGHTACATIVYAGLARVLGAGRRPSLAAAILVAGTVGVSRVALGFHTPAEAALGAAVGLAGTVALLRYLPPDPLGRARPRLALVAATATGGGALHGHPAPVARLLQPWRGCWTRGPGRTATETGSRLTAGLTATPRCTRPPAWSPRSSGCRSTWRFVRLRARAFAERRALRVVAREVVARRLRLEALT